MDVLWKISQPAMFLVILWTSIVTDTLVKADVYVRRQNDTKPIIHFKNGMAKFGPEVPDSGISGYLHPVKPFNACLPVAPPPNETSKWIALIARGNCTFVKKVHNVQEGGYSMAIVYNFPRNNSLSGMSGDGSRIIIPSVFVGWSNGLLLKTNYCYFCTSVDASIGNYIVTVDNKEEYKMDLLWMIVFLGGFCLILLAIMVLIITRNKKGKKQKSRLSAKHLKKIATEKFKKGCCGILP